MVVIDAERAEQPVSPYPTLSQLKALASSAREEGPDQDRRSVELAEALGEAGAPFWEAARYASEEMTDAAWCAHAAGSHRRAVAEVRRLVESSDPECRAYRGYHDLIETAAWSADLPSPKAVVRAALEGAGACASDFLTKSGTPRQALRHALRLARLEMRGWDWTQPERALLTPEADWKRAYDSEWRAANKRAEAMLRAGATNLVLIAREVGAECAILGLGDIAEAVALAAPPPAPPQHKPLADAVAQESIPTLPAAVIAAEPFKPTLDLRPRLRRSSYDSSAEIAPTPWRVKGLLPKTGLGMLYGESGAAKTFLAVHLALCVAYGLPFFGRRVKQGGVVVVASEAGKSVKVRLKAAEKAMEEAIRAAGLIAGRPLRRAPIEVIDEAPKLSKDGEPVALAATVEDAAAVIRAAGHELGLVVIDTLHASMGGGDENSAADAAAVLTPTREIAEDLACQVLFIHHPGKDVERGARGSYAFHAAMDAVIGLEAVGCGGPKAKTTEALRRATVTKLRDGEAGGKFAYKLRVVEIGRDEDGEPLTTCVIEPVTEAAVESGPKLGGRARDLLAVVRALAGPEGSANLDTVREKFVAGYRAGNPNAKESAPRTAWKRATDELTEADLIAVQTEENRIQLLQP